MLLRPSRHDIQVIGWTLGRVLGVVGLAMVLPALLAAGTGRWNEAAGFVIGAAVAIVAVAIGEYRLRPAAELTWSQALLAVAAGWPLAAVLAAVPLFLSGHYHGFGDAWVESMSGLTATGLTLVQDLDHLPESVNLWRHLLQLLGAQTMIFVGLSLFTAASRPAGTLTVGETRSQRILPNLPRTAIAVAQVAGSFAVAGILGLVVSGWAAGLEPLRALWHGTALFLSAFDTSGFSPSSANAGFYRSPWVESVLLVLMLAGALSFPLHIALRRGDRRELVRNLESRTAAATFVTLLAVALIGLARAGALTDFVPLTRQGLFAMVSAHTTTGLTLIDGRLLATDWGLLAPAALVAAMAVGGMAASPAGGIRAFRVGLTMKGIAADVRRVLLPESAVVASTYHHGRRYRLDDVHVRLSAGLLLLFLITYLAGGLIVLGFVGDVEFTEAFFESTSATSTTGMSIGVLTPDSPAVVKATFFAQMWLGRLEFLAVFALIGFLITLGRPRT